jgi:hypothetical protein
VGDRVKIISEEENGWRRGILAEANGWFPETYVDLEAEPTIEEWMPAVVDDPDAPVMPKRDKPFPAPKTWNHGRISRQQVEERLKAHAGSKEDGIFLARQKDKDCFSVGIQFSDDADAPPKFVLFEKKSEKWFVDKNYEVPRGDTLAKAVEDVLVDVGVRNADGVPKPEAP